MKRFSFFGMRPEFPKSKEERFYFCGILAMVFVGAIIVVVFARLGNTSSPDKTVCDIRMIDGIEGNWCVCEDNTTQFLPRQPGGGADLRPDCDHDGKGDSQYEAEAR